MVPSRGYLSRLIEVSLKNGLPLIRYAFKWLAKIVLSPLRLTEPAAADARIHKSISEAMTTILVLPNKE